MFTGFIGISAAGERPVAIRDSKIAILDHSGSSHLDLSPQCDEWDKCLTYRIPSRHCVSGLRKDHGVGFVKLDESINVPAVVRLLPRLVKLLWILRWHLRPCGCQKRRHTSCNLLILAEQSPEPVAPSDCVRLARRPLGEWS
jgi:hypothetical protein